ncbi:Hypothetical protein DAL_152 [Psychrobacter phage D'Alembert]|nr:Hypothetical protein DAL_9 [Psychrobacter phage D'Alembert]CAH1193558.1 Hypothetical protein DAL_152 [Psychrobacter phage D'Alembert]
MTTQNTLLIVNRHTCPRTAKLQIQAHELTLDDMSVISYPNMQGDDLSLFKHHDRVVVVDVQKVSQLNSINIVTL